MFHNQKTTSFQKRLDDYFQNNGFSFKQDAAEDSSFQIVDTSKTQSKNKFGFGEYSVRYYPCVLYVLAHIFIFHCFDSPQHCSETAAVHQSTTKCEPNCRKREQPQRWCSWRAYPTEQQ